MCTYNEVEWSGVVRLRQVGRLQIMQAWARRIADDAEVAYKKKKLKIELMRPSNLLYVVVKEKDEGKIHI